MSGKLIVFEGIDGTGKETQTKLLMDHFGSEGVPATTFSVPRYETKIGKIIKNALEGKYGDFKGLDPHLSAIPYFMDYLLAREETFAHLETGHVVVDRYVESTFAYHSAKVRGAKQTSVLRELQEFAYEEMKIPKPDLIFLLDMPEKVSRSLMSSRKRDQFERDTAYQKRVASVYERMAEGKNWRVISCAPKGVLRSRADIHEEIWGIVERELGM